MSIIKTGVLVISALFFASIGYCQNGKSVSENQSYVNKDSGITVSVPSGWLIFDETHNTDIFKEMKSVLEGNIIFAFSKNKDCSPPYVLITKDALSNEFKDKTIEELSMMSREDMQGQFSSSEIIEPAHIVTINGKKFSKYVLRMSVGSALGNYLTYDYKSEGTVITIQCESEEKESGGYKEIFDSIAGSIRLD